MEREPEEDHDSEHCEESIHALLDFLCHGELLFFGVADCCSGFLLSRIRENLLGSQEDSERNHHGSHGCDEGIVDTCIEVVEVVSAEASDCFEVGRIEGRACVLCFGDQVV